jgi:hypothetical protein
MEKCGHCEHLAVTVIPADPYRVCVGHAIEYWKGLLAYAMDHPPVDPAPSAVCRPPLGALRRGAAGEAAPVQPQAPPRRPGRVLKTSHWGRPGRRTA